MDALQLKMYTSDLEFEDPDPALSRARMLQRARYLIAMGDWPTPWRVFAEARIPFWLATRYVEIMQASGEWPWFAQPPEVKTKREIWAYHQMMAAQMRVDPSPEEIRAECQIILAERRWWRIRSRRETRVYRAPRFRRSSGSWA